MFSKGGFLKKHIQILSSELCNIDKSSVEQKLLLLFFLR